MLDQRAELGIGTFGTIDGVERQDEIGYMAEPCGDLHLGSGFTPFTHHAGWGAFFALTDDAAAFAGITDIGPQRADRCAGEMVMIGIVELAALVNEGVLCPFDQLGRRFEYWVKQFIKRVALDET